MNVIMALIALLIGFETISSRACGDAHENIKKEHKRADLLSDEELAQAVDEAVSSLKKEFSWTSKGNKSKSLPLKHDKTPVYLKNHPFMQPLTTLTMLRRLARTTTEIEFDVQAATSSFGAANNREDLSSRVFGKKDIQLQDIALVTRLAARGGIFNPVPPGNATDFEKIAAEPVVFKASTHREQLQLNGSAVFFDDRLRFSVALPIVVGTNQLRVDNDGSLSDKAIKRGLPPLRGDFANYTLSAFVDALVGNMGMKTGERVTTYGLGQAFVGATYEFQLEKMEHAQIGVQLFLPTAPNPDTNRVWSVALAPNNLALGVSGSLLYAHNRYLNPYVQLDGRVNAASKAPRRVPRFVSGDGANLPTNKMALGGYVAWARAPELGNNFKNQSEASVRGFADFSSDTRWRLGESLTLQVGNIFGRVAGRGGYLDCAYRVAMKLRDQVLEVRPFGRYDTEVLMMNTDEISHQLKVGYGYHFTDAFRLSFMTTLVFAGNNVPQTYGATALFGFSF